MDFTEELAKGKSKIVTLGEEMRNYDRFETPILVWGLKKMLEVANIALTKDRINLHHTINLINITEWLEAILK